MNTDEQAWTKSLELRLTWILRAGSPMHDRFERKEREGAKSAKKEFLNLTAFNDPYLAVLATLRALRSNEIGKVDRSASIRLSAHRSTMSLAATSVFSQNPKYGRSRWGRGQSVLVWSRRNDSAGTIETGHDDDDEKWVAIQKMFRTCQFRTRPGDAAQRAQTARASNTTLARWRAPIGPRQRRSEGNFVSPGSQVGVFSRALGSFPYVVDWRSGCRVSSVVGASELGRHRMTGIGANHQLAWFCRPKTLALELMDDRRNTPLHSLELMKMKADGLISVLCVDDNFLVAEGLRLKLLMAGGFHWLGHLSDADALMERVREDRPAVVLLDIDMPGKNAFEALAELSREEPEVRVIVISGHVRAELVDSALDAGAWGYLSKGDEADGIVLAIHRVLDGQCVLGNDAKAAFRIA